MATFSDGHPHPHPHPHHPYRQPTSPTMTDFQSLSSLAGDVRLQLQALLDTKEKQLQHAGALGQRVLAQQVELEERVRLLQELEADRPEDEEVGADMRERMRDLAETVRAWDDENVALSSAFGASRPTNSSQLSLPYQPPDLPAPEPERPKPSAGTSAAQSSRRAKNAAHRADDVEFAFEIGSGLLTEVRRLQSLLGERDKAIQDMKEEKDDLERTVESLRDALKSQEQSTDKYKEENWNLEVSLQELRTQLTDTQSTVQRLEGDNKRITRQLNNSREATDQHKNESERLKNAFDELKAKHETDIAHARKHAASLQRDKGDLQQSLDHLKADVARQGRRLPRFGSPLTPDAPQRTPAQPDGEEDDVFSIAASTNRRRQDNSVLFNEGEYDSSPDVSPSRPFLAPNHPSNEVEALQQRLAHAQRQINTLKGTLQREKELKIEYRRRLDTAPGTPVAADEEVSEDEGKAEASGTGKRRLTPYRVGRGGRGRGRGRGGLTLMERLENAARSPASEYDEEPEFADVTASPPPPVPAIPRTLVDAELDEEPESPPHQYDEPAIEPVSPPPSNRTSVDGMDPAFANILRRSSSSGSLPYNRSPLRNAVVARTLPRRRGGAAFQEARPPSLVGQPEALAAELGLGMAPVAESATPVVEVETAEFACQTEEVEVVPTPPIQITPAAPETGEMGVQVEPAPEPVVEPEPVPVVEPAPKVETAECSMQTDPEPEPEPEPVPPPVVVEHSEIGIQYEDVEPVKPPVVYADAAMETEPEPAPVLPLPPSLSDAEVQTPRVHTLEVDIQTTPAIVVDKFDADVQTDAMQLPRVREVFSRPESVDLSRRTTITQADLSGDTTIRGLRNVSGNSTIRGLAAAYEDEFDDNETETGAETDNDSEYHDARQSIMMATPTTQEYATSDFHSVRTLTDNEAETDDEDAESIKASRMPSPVGGAHSRASTALSNFSAFGGRPDSVYMPAVSYESVGVSADLLPEPAPEPEREPEPPKPELKEMCIQTEPWVPTPPVSPAPPAPSTPPVAASPAVLASPVPVAPVSPHPSILQPGQSQTARPSPSMHQFQYISPPSSAGPTATATPGLGVPVSPVAVRDSVATIVPRARTVHDRRQSIESTLSGAMDDNTPRSRLPSMVPSPVDKTRPPMMVLPPPPRAPPPPNSMPPPQFIPDRRAPTVSSSSFDVPPGRPVSPPPPELIQRATTPTLAASLRPSFASQRPHGSSMPPSQQGLRQPPSTNSFRSAANAATYAQTMSSIPAGLATFRGREMSSTSLHSDHSLGSGRSSMSSDHHFFNRQPAQAAPAAPTTPSRGGMGMGMSDMSTRGVGSTDPSVIHAITQTMIGEFLYKYTRRTIGKGHGEKRHKRFFWVHPYTKTLYWSSADPGSSNVIEQSAKSAYIEAVRSVLDPNPMPPGLYQYSVIVSTPQREMKISAPTKERHDIWLNALKYLLARPGAPTGASPANGSVHPPMPPMSPMSAPVELDEEPQQQQLLSSPQSFRSVQSNQTSGESWNVTPRGQRSQSQLSAGGSIGKRSGTPAAEYLRWAGNEPYSPTKSFEHVPSAQDPEDLDFELHDDSLSEEGFQGLENVRACCDGRHTVGRSGIHEHDHHHHHHHHHTNPQQNGNGQARREPSRTRGEHLEAHPAEVARPASPAWSFRSRAGSATSHDGGLFGGKLRFGSRRSKVTPVGNQE